MQVGVSDRAFVFGGREEAGKIRLEARGDLGVDLRAIHPCRSQRQRHAFLSKDVTRWRRCLVAVGSRGALAACSAARLEGIAGSTLIDGVWSALQTAGRTAALTDCARGAIDCHPTPRARSRDGDPSSERRSQAPAGDIQAALRLGLYYCYCSKGESGLSKGLGELRFGAKRGKSGLTILSSESDFPPLDGAYSVAAQPLFYVFTE